MGADINRFENIGLDKNILKGIEELGFEKPMPVQAKVIPHMLDSDRDIVGLAQTGTGKTAAFGLPLIQRIDTKDSTPQALILSPTRELCIQIAQDLTNFAKYVSGLKIVAVYGGASIETQIKSIARGVQIVVATPGRLLDLIKRRRIDISGINSVVLDEADEMLNMGFQEELTAILATTPDDKRTCLFSATMPAEVENIASSYLNDPIQLEVGTRNSGSENVSHICYMVRAKDRYLALKRIVDYYPSIYGIIFCRTRWEAKEIAENLIKDGYNADALHGDLSQAQRESVMNKFRLRALQMVVATDVAARGLDVENLTHVINYNLPDDIQVYTHRSGRTGRAGKTGISIALIHQKEKYKIKNIEKMTGRGFEYQKVPNGEVICEKQLFNMIDRMESVTVEDERIDDYMKKITKKLEWLSKEEIIKRFVSLEFNRFLEYYKNAPDLNIDFSEKKRRKKGERRDDTSFKRLFINLGKKDGLTPQNLIGIVNDASGRRDIEIGKIEIMNSFSFFGIEEAAVPVFLDGLGNQAYKGRQIVAEPASEKPKGDRKSFRKDRGDRGDRKRDKERSFSAKDREGSRKKDSGKRRSSDKNSSFKPAKRAGKRK